MQKIGTTSNCRTMPRKYYNLASCEPNQVELHTNIEHGRVNERKWKHSWVRTQGNNLTQARLLQFVLRMCRLRRAAKLRGPTPLCRAISVLGKGRVAAKVKICPANSFQDCCIPVG
jgi:hypothetical protein